MFYAVIEVYRKTEVVGYYMYEWGTRKSSFWDLERLADYCSTVGDYAIQNMSVADGKLTPVWQSVESFPKLFLDSNWKVQESKDGTVVLGFELGYNSFMNYKYADSWMVQCLRDGKIRRYSLNQMVGLGIKETLSVFTGDKPVNSTIAYRRAQLNEENNYTVCGACVKETLNNLGISDIILSGIEDTKSVVELKHYCHVLTKVICEEGKLLKHLSIGGFIHFLGDNALKDIKTELLSVTGGVQYNLKSVLQADVHTVDLSSSTGLLTNLSYNNSYELGSITELCLPYSTQGMVNSCRENYELKKLSVGVLKPDDLTCDFENYKVLEEIEAVGTAIDLDVLKSVASSQLGRNIIVTKRKDVGICKEDTYSWF